MSRLTYPTQLRDHLGREVRLSPKPFATGGEGAVFDVLGHPELVAKLYSKPQSKDRCDKLRAMAKLCSPDLLKFAAWPTATLSDGNQASVDGILMPRISDHKEIHHLYSVAQRKKDFPDADWGFLLHTARNCAIAFENVHSHGHVVGDVNQKNVMVSKKGIVALVDCDSFQVKDGNRIFRCGVGVPEYTPPELHGRKFTDVDRDTNHDLFGLAVMVFHLLMMGRHPFAGVPQVNFDIPIEKAIQEGLYAYTRNPTKLKPPPHVPPLAMLDVPTRSLFERAFCSSQRPAATEWRTVLDASMQGLQSCKNDVKHIFLPSSASCPWCQLIAVSRLMFFIPGSGAAGTTLRIEDIRRLIQTLSGMQLVFSVYTRPKPVGQLQVTQPTGLYAIPKPTLLTYPLAPLPLPKPILTPLPLPPVFASQPVALRPLPPSPAVPLPPWLRRHPIPPTKLPYPKLHANPAAPAYPPVPTPDLLEPPDRFLARLFLAASIAGVPVYFVAWPIGLIMMITCSILWLILPLAESNRRAKDLRSLQDTHEAECEQLNEAYIDRVRPIEKANKKLVNAWEAANAANAANHARQCDEVDEENRQIVAPWEAAKAAIEADHQRATQEVEDANRYVLLAWEARNTARQTAYEKSCREMEQDNQKRTAAWSSLVASRQVDHDQECRRIDAKNRQLTDAWAAANAPWIDEQKRWRDRATSSESRIKRMENELLALRSASLSIFMRRKGDADGVLRSHDSTHQDYERELRQAEKDSEKIQLDEFLDRSLICNAKLSGITGDRIHALESFGIQTAKDIVILNNLKVPGIGLILSTRLFDWRHKLAKSFHGKTGLPDSEKNRIEMRFMPVLRPLSQVIQTAINDLDAISASHRAREAEHFKAIAEAVQDLAVAEAYIVSMNVM
jgi:DNA-binding helix-hairpin-helix protein with protein kinase domain